MQEKKSMAFPPALLFLDVIATLIMGLGLAKYFADVDVIPVSMRFENYGPIFIGIGAALMLPFMVHVVGKIKADAQNRRS